MPLVHPKAPAPPASDLSVMPIFELEGDRISGITFFLDTARYFPLFGLPARLDP